MEGGARTELTSYHQHRRTRSFRLIQHILCGGPPPPLGFSDAECWCNVCNSYRAHMQAYSQIMHDAVVLKGYVIRVLHLVLVGTVGGGGSFLACTLAIHDGRHALKSPPSMVWQ